MTVTDSNALTRLQQEQARLETLREEVLSEHGEGGEADQLGELSSYDQHQADVGSEVFEREKDLSIVQQVEEQIGEVKAAMTRLHDGTYGRCERCGKPIGGDRLDAIPWARLCLDDQAAGERSGGAGP